MKHFNLLLALTLLLSQLAILQAEEPADLLKDKDSISKIKENPDDFKALLAFANANFGSVSTLMATDLDKAEKSLAAMAKLMASIEPEDAKAKSLKGQILSAIPRFKSRIEQELKLLELIGKNTIPLGIDQWTNGAPIVDAELKGKVVLLDFWAVWCGPCVATFPHLVEWNKEYADDGLVILGLTRFYNFKWDDETKSAVRSTEPVEPEAELAVLEKFAQSHKLGHRIGIQPKDSKLSEYFAVTGIPHVVLIDRQGKIQMVKVGSHPSNAKALHAKIKELLAE